MGADIVVLNDNNLTELTKKHIQNIIDHQPDIENILIAYNFRGEVDFKYAYENKSHFKMLGILEVLKKIIIENAGENLVG